MTYRYTDYDKAPFHVKCVLDALKDNGIAANGYRVDVVAEKIDSYNYCKLTVTCYEPRKHIAATAWEVPYNMTRKLLDWDDAKLIYNRY